jgi:hypothetical protein
MLPYTDKINAFLDGAIPRLKGTLSIQPFVHKVHNDWKQVFLESLITERR